MVTYIDKDRYTDIIRNKTRIINVTKNIIKYINKTVYNDAWQNKHDGLTKLYGPTKPDGLKKQGGNNQTR